MKINKIFFAKSWKNNLDTKDEHITNIFSASILCCVKHIRAYPTNLNRVLINRAPSSIQLHPPPPSSFQPPPSSIQLISADTQLSVTPSALLEPNYRTQLGIFPKFRLKHSKLSILTEN